MDRRRPRWQPVRHCRRTGRHVPTAGRDWRWVTTCASCGAWRKSCRCRRGLVTASPAVMQLAEAAARHVAIPSRRAVPPGACAACMPGSQRRRRRLIGRVPGNPPIGERPPLRHRRRSCSRISTSSTRALHQHGAHAVANGRLTRCAERWRRSGSIWRPSIFGRTLPSTSRSSTSCCASGECAPTTSRSTSSSGSRC